MDRILKNLDKINPNFARPNTFCANGALLPFLLSIMAFVLAMDAAPTLDVFDNLICILCGTIGVISAILLFIPRVFQWDWNVKYFGVAITYIGSVALFGGIPWCCILLYSKLPIAIRCLSFLTYVGILVFWCKRFPDVYAEILDRDNDKFGIYREEDDAIYYLQKVDVEVLERDRRFEQFPRPICIVLFLIAAFSMLPFSSFLKNLVGLPFTHIFLAVAAIPTDMMAIGLMTRGLIIFYYRPMLIFRRTGKSVYIDMEST